MNKKVSKKKDVVATKKAEKPAFISESKSRVFRYAVLGNDRDKVFIEARSSSINGLANYELSIRTPKIEDSTTLTNFKNIEELIDRYNAEIKKFEKEGYVVIEERAFDEKEERTIYKLTEKIFRDEPDIFDIPI